MDKLNVYGAEFIGTFWLVLGGAQPSSASG